MVQVSALSALLLIHKGFTLFDCYRLMHVSMFQLEILFLCLAPKVCPMVSMQECTTSISCNVFICIGQVQLLVSDSDVENYKQIKVDLDRLRLLVEKSELWVFKMKSEGKKEKKKSDDGEDGDEKVNCLPCPC